MAEWRRRQADQSWSLFDTYSTGVCAGWREEKLDPYFMPISLRKKQLICTVTALEDTRVRSTLLSHASNAALGFENVSAGCCNFWMACSVVAGAIKPRFCPNFVSPSLKMTAWPYEAAREKQSKLVEQEKLLESFTFHFKGIKYLHALCVINFQSSVLGW